MRWWFPPRAALRNVRATMGILGDSRALSRIRFLSAAERAGLLEQLRSPITAAELVGVLRVSDSVLLEGLLNLGAAVGELRSHGGRYSLKGSRARALASDGGDALRAFTTELADYHGEVFRDLSGQLFGQERGRYLDEYDELIARSSLVLEPFIARFVRRVVTERPTGSLLEIGCGTGRYVRHAAEACPQLVAVGIDMSERACALAAANFSGWGLAGRCTALHVDIRRADIAGLGGPFDVITLHNNVYYFSAAERDRLLADLLGHLAPGGRLVLTSFFTGKTVAAAEFDLVLRATAGCWPLPGRAEVASALKAAGYRTVA
ncbi:MAG TPA: class I SAM-dependent methyltransferase, partial [Mycobacterium sp.]|nr:class I SAM-dependent methyltransferase [Mycobacterium sp.]